MSNITYELSEINESIIELTDKYIKAVISNSKIDAVRKKERRKKSGFIVCCIDNFYEKLIYEESSFENILLQRFQVNGVNFFINNDNLVEALLHLTEIQRKILFQTEIAQKTQREIAKEMGVSFQMISKHRKSAIKKLKEELNNEKEN
jgi:RNA polymerase sigma factor (sigma-70 family)